MIALDRLLEGNRYLKEALDHGGGDDQTYHTAMMTSEFLSGQTDWDRHAEWAASRPDSYLLDGSAD